MLTVEDLHTYFPIRAGVLERIVGYVKAVDGISFNVERGEIFGLVGESGSGKTTLAKTILRLIEPTRGRIIFDGVDVTKLTGEELRSIRRRMQIVFQDPYASLDPRQTIKSALIEPMKVHGLVRDRDEALKRAADLIRRVGLNEDHLNRFPHEFSGGQRQRIAVARTLAVEPEFIILDEPTSFLDVSVQAQILNLLLDLQEEYRLTYMFISHNLNVIRHVSDRIAVMYLGKLVEVGSKDEIFNNPAHPYTQALISAIPEPTVEQARYMVVLPGDTPSPVNIPSGCRFHPRCKYAKDVCFKVEPNLEEVDRRLFACYRPHFRGEEAVVAKK